MRSISPESEEIKLKGIRLEAQLYADQLDTIRSQTDANIICSDGIIPIHRCMLMSVSSLLKDLLADGDLSEVQNIHLPDVERKYVSHVFSVLYTGSTTVMESEHAGVVEAFRLLGMKPHRDISLQMRNAFPGEPSLFKPVRFYNLSNINEDEYTMRDNATQGSSRSYPSAQPRWVKREVVSDDDVDMDSDDMETEGRMYPTSDIEDDDQILLNEETSNTNPFVCVLCNAGFSSHKDLDTHARTVDCAQEIIRFGVPGEANITKRHCYGCGLQFPEQTTTEFLQHVNACKSKRSNKRSHQPNKTKTPPFAKSCLNRLNQLCDKKTTPAKRGRKPKASVNVPNSQTPSTSRSALNLNGILTSSQENVEAVTFPEGVRITRSKKCRTLATPLEPTPRRKYVRKAPSTPKEKKKERKRKRKKRSKRSRNDVTNPTLPNSITDNGPSVNGTLDPCSSTAAYPTNGLRRHSVTHHTSNGDAINSNEYEDQNTHEGSMKRKKKDTSNRSSPGFTSARLKYVTINNSRREVWVSVPGQDPESFTPAESQPLGRRVIEGQLYEVFGRISAANNKLKFKPHFYIPVGKNTDSQESSGQRALAGALAQT